MFLTIKQYNLLKLGIEGLTIVVALEVKHVPFFYENPSQSHIEVQV
jgi:hypothetical protein